MRSLIGIVGLATLALTVPAPARAELCEKHKGKMYMTVVGTCSECGGHTAVRGFKLCKACSTRLGQCEACRAVLTASTRPRSMLDPLELNDPDSGTRHTVFIEQVIHVRLSGDPKSSFRWSLESVSGPAIEAMAPAPSGPKPSPRSVFAFSFRAARVGQAVVKLRYAGVAATGRQPRKWFVAVFDVKPDRTTERILRLKGNLEQFMLRLDYVGPQDKPFPSLVLSVAQPGTTRIDELKASGLIGHLARTGWMARATDAADAPGAPIPGPAYIMTVTGAGLRLRESLGWELGMLKTLDALRQQLSGDAAKALDRVLARLSGLRRQWQAAGKAPKTDS